MKRILHVVGAMNRGGVETWLMHVLRNVDRKRYQFDFLVHDPRPGAYDDEVRSLGSQIIPCLGYQKPWRYARNFKRLLKQHGPYDVIHSHVHHYSGFVLRLAHQVNVPVRIAHSHNDTRRIQEAAGHARKLYYYVMKKWLRQHSLVWFAASQLAAHSLFGLDARMVTQVVYYGLDFSPFRIPVSRQKTRAQLGIPADAVVIGHVGRFVEQKNHRFILEVAREAILLHGNTYVLLVGDGPLRPFIRQYAAELDISEKVITTGVRPDVAGLMMGAMDLFFLPSLYEGLGIVLVEAQAAGLPCVISDVIPGEAEVVDGLVRRLSLAEPAEKWAEELLRAKESTATRSSTRKAAVDLVERSIFSLSNCLEQLENVYSG
jgi:glycosyltransferase involved in cell wall biosynthesis